MAHQTHHEVPAIYQQKLSENELPSVSSLPIRTFVEHFTEIQNVLKLEGTHIFYLPSIDTDLATDNPEATVTEELKSLRDVLEKTFRVPRFFWDKMGWDANGFFGSVDDPMGESQEKMRSHCSYCRFLIKEVSENQKTVPGSTMESPQYYWRFLAFYTLWFQVDQSKPSQILLCFDLNEPEWKEGRKPSPWPMRLAFIEALNVPCRSISTCPYGIYGPILEEVIKQFNRACWTFRKPVREVEKMNDKDTNDTTEKDSKEKKLQERKARITKYRNMHELSRHIIHATETLGAASNTVSGIIRQSKLCSELCCKDRTPTNRKLLFYESFLLNLNLRAKAFDERLRNQIQLSFNLVDVEDTENTRQILEGTKSDGRELTRFVAWLSIFLLPPTYTSGFFGMNFFIFHTWHWVWVYFVLTVGMIFLIFLAVVLYSPVLELRLLGTKRHRRRDAES